jgi:hypothetical protein
MPSPEGEPAADREAIVAAIVEEACVAETLAAIEAQHAAGQATDPAVAETLRTIADDELRHAILGWRALAWALRDASPTMRVAAQAAFERAKAMAEAEALRAPTEGDPTQLRAHGVLASADRLALTRQALRQVVEPCFCDLLA